MRKIWTWMNWMGRLCTGKELALLNNVLFIISKERSRYYGLGMLFYYENWQLVVMNGNKDSKEYKSYPKTNFRIRLLLNTETHGLFSKLTIQYMLLTSVRTDLLNKCNFSTLAKSHTGYESNWESLKGLSGPFLLQCTPIWSNYWVERRNVWRSGDDGKKFAARTYRQQAASLHSFFGLEVWEN